MENIKYKIFVITIERNKKRYTSLLEKLKEQGFKEDDINIFIGVDYKKDIIPDNVLSKWSKFSPRGVLACAASHVLLWKYISEQDIDFALILEDDSYVNKEEFDKYLYDFKNVINDNTFLNLSTAYTIPSTDTYDNVLFTNSKLVLSLDTYILTPCLCKKLFLFYKENGLSYHIDLHLSFIKKYIPMKILHFNKKITISNMRHESTMVSSHNKKFFLKMISGTETYKELNTPIISYQNIDINAYIIFVFIFFIFLIFFSFSFVDYENNIIFRCILFILWFVLGCAIYDIL